MNIKQYMVQAEQSVLIISYLTTDILFVTGYEDGVPIFQYDGKLDISSSAVAAGDLDTIHEEGGGAGLGGESGQGDSSVLESSTIEGDDDDDGGETSTNDVSMAIDTDMDETQHLHTNIDRWTVVLL